MTEPLLLTVEQVAETLQVSKWFVYDHPEELGLVKLGRSNRYSRQRVEEFVSERAARSAPSVASSPPSLHAVPELRSTLQGRASPRVRPRRVPLLEPGRRAA